MLQGRCLVMLGVVYMARIIKYIYVTISSAAFGPSSITLEESQITDERNVQMSDRENEGNRI